LKHLWCSLNFSTIICSFKKSNTTRIETMVM